MRKQPDHFFCVLVNLLFLIFLCTSCRPASHFEKASKETESNPQFRAENLGSRNLGPCTANPETCVQVELTFAVFSFDASPIRNHPFEVVANHPQLLSKDRQTLTSDNQGRVKIILSLESKTFDHSEKFGVGLSLSAQPFGSRFMNCIIQLASSNPLLSVAEVNHTNFKPTLELNQTALLVGAVDLTLLKETFASNRLTSDCIFQINFEIKSTHFSSLFPLRNIFISEDGAVTFEKIPINEFGQFRRTVRIHRALLDDPLLEPLPIAIKLQDLPTSPIFYYELRIEYANDPHVVAFIPVQTPEKNPQTTDITSISNSKFQSLAVDDLSFVKSKTTQNWWNEIELDESLQPFFRYQLSFRPLLNRMRVHAFDERERVALPGVRICGRVILLDKSSTIGEQPEPLNLQSVKIISSMFFNETIASSERLRLDLRAFWQSSTSSSPLNFFLVFRLPEWTKASEGTFYWNAAMKKLLSPPDSTDSFSQLIESLKYQLNNMECPQTVSANNSNELKWNRDLKEKAFGKAFSAMEAPLFGADSTSELPWVTNELKLLRAETTSDFFSKNLPHIEQFAREAHLISAGPFDLKSELQVYEIDLVKKLLGYKPATYSQSEKRLPGSPSQTLKVEDLRIDFKAELLPCYLFYFHSKTRASSEALYCSDESKLEEATEVWHRWKSDQGDQRYHQLLDTRGNELLELRSQHLELFKLQTTSEKNGILIRKIFPSSSHLPN